MRDPKMVCQLAEPHATDFLLQSVFVGTVTQFQCRLIDHTDMSAGIRNRKSLPPASSRVSSEY